MRSYNSNFDSNNLTSSDQSLTFSSMSGGDRLYNLSGDPQPSQGLPAIAPQQSGKGWDFANNLIGLASNIIDLRGGKTNETVAAPEPLNTGGGISALAIGGIVIGVGLLGLIIYKIAK